MQISTTMSLPLTIYSWNVMSNWAKSLKKTSSTSMIKRYRHWLSKRSPSNLVSIRWRWRVSTKLCQWRKTIWVCLKLKKRKGMSLLTFKAKDKTLLNKMTSSIQASSPQVSNYQILKMCKVIIFQLPRPLLAILMSFLLLIRTTLTKEISWTRPWQFKRKRWTSPW